ncbi:hypothetical protein Tco_0507896 [Tanacetum coccineum]
MNEFVNDGIKFSKLEINTSFINELPKKWLAFCQSLRNINHVKESELASLFGKLKYEENIINSIYDTNKDKTLVPATPLSTAFFSTSIVQDFQDSPDDEEDTRSSQEYMNDLKEEYQARALLAKSKRFFKKGTQRFSSTKSTNQTKCHKCGKKAHFAGDYWSKTLVPSYQSPFQLKLLHSSEHKPEPRHTKDLEAKYNKVKTKLALLSSNVSAPSSSSAKNKGLFAETYDWDKDEVSSDDNECISEQIPTQKKKNLRIDQLTEDTSSSGLKDPVFIKSLADNSEVSITEYSTLSNHDTGKLMNLQSVAPLSSAGEADWC